MLPNTPLLKAVKTDPKKLEAERYRLTPYAGKHQKFWGTAILRCVKSRSDIDPCEKAIGVPWIDFTAIEIVALEPEPVDAHVAGAPQLSEEEAWLQENHARILDLYQTGKTSLYAMAKPLGISRDSRKGRALRAFLEQLKAGAIDLLDSDAPVRKTEDFPATATTTAGATTKNPQVQPCFLSHCSPCVRLKHPKTSTAAEQMAAKRDAFTPVFTGD